LADPLPEDRPGFHPFEDRIRSDFAGFSRLALLARQAEIGPFEDVDVDLTGVEWLDANMCAPLGAILYRAGRRGNSVTLSNVQSESGKDVRGILLRNGFLSHYGQTRWPDKFGTTVEYRRFEPKDQRAFAEYAEAVLKGAHVPKMTTALRKWMMESVCEIFGNAVMHSKTQFGIHACGQYYRSKPRLDFTVADVGIGIPGSLKEKTGKDVAAIEAIQWAVTGLHTTRNDNVPGGVGLKRLREFITLNKGRMQIASGRGYWELAKSDESSREMEYPFPGTVVNLEFNTADQRSFCLESELTPDKVL